MVTEPVDRSGFTVQQSKVVNIAIIEAERKRERFWSGRVDPNPTRFLTPTLISRRLLSQFF